MPPLDERLLQTERPDDEAAVYGILAATILVLPVAVREKDPALVLKENGYAYVSALLTLRVDDLELLGFDRGHAAMIMSVLRLPGPEIYTVRASPSETIVTNTTMRAAPAPQSGHGNRQRCRPFPAVLTSRAWRAFLLTFVAVL